MIVRSTKVGGEFGRMLKVKNKIIAASLISFFCYANCYAESAQFKYPVGDVKGFVVLENHNLKAKSEFRETNDNDEYIDFLFQLNKNHNLKPKGFEKLLKFVGGEGDTDLKFNLNDVKLSIPYYERPILKAKAFGYAPIGGYQKGWTGIKTFFSDPDLGICTYSLEKITYIQVDGARMNRIINGYPSFQDIEGNKKGGYLYSVSWDIDQKEFVYDHEIECANKVYDSQIMDKLIEFAKSIAS